MTESRFPTDPFQDLRNLQRTVEGNAAGTGSPLLEASAGWVMRNRSTPPLPPTGDVHIYAQGGQLWSASTYGVIALDQTPKASAVSPVGAASAGPSYTSSEQDLLNQLKDRVNLILVNLKIAGLMSNF